MKILITIFSLAIFRSTETIVPTQYSLPLNFFDLSYFVNLPGGWTFRRSPPASRGWRPAWGPWCAQRHARWCRDWWGRRWGNQDGHCERRESSSQCRWRHSPTAGTPETAQFSLKTSMVWYKLEPKLGTGLLIEADYHLIRKFSVRTRNFGQVMMKSDQASMKSMKNECWKLTQRQLSKSLGPASRGG